MKKPSNPQARQFRPPDSDAGDAGPQPLASGSSAAVWGAFLLLAAGLLHTAYRWTVPLEYLLAVPLWEIALRAMAACLGVYLLCRQRHIAGSWFAGGLFGLSLLMHFPGPLTFHWDEWELLWRWAERGLEAVVIAHGAHVMPLFMLYFFGMLKAFSYSYLLLLVVSAVFLAANGLALERFLLMLGLGHVFDRRAVRLLCCLFVISSLQLEVMQWAFIQCVTLQNTATLLAASEACLWQRTGSRRALWISLAMLGLSPLLQGTGVITIGVCLLALAASCGIQLVTADTQRDAPAAAVRKAAAYTALAAAASLPAILLYVVFGTSPEAPDLSWQMFRYADMMLAFFLSGTLGVTVMRGIGLFPSLKLEPDYAERLWAELPGSLQQFFGTLNDAVVFLGSVVLLALLLLLIADRRRWKLNMLLFAAGCLLIAGLFLLPTLGRFHFGVAASIHQRYQTRHLAGLALIVLPLLSRWIFESRSAAISAFCWLLVFVHIGIQARMQARAVQFIEYSIRTEQLVCRAQRRPGENIRPEIERTISPHWAFNGDILRLVLDAHGLQCNENTDGDDEIP